MGRGAKRLCGTRQGGCDRNDARAERTGTPCVHCLSAVPVENQDGQPECQGDRPCRPPLRKFLSARQFPSAANKQHPFRAKSAGSVPYTAFLRFTRTPT